MKFKHTLKSRASLSKKEIVEFKGLTADIIEKGMRATFKNPFYFRNDKEGCTFELYCDRGKLNVVMLHSWDKFIEVKE